MKSRQPKCRTEHPHRDAPNADIPRGLRVTMRCGLKKYEARSGTDGERSTPHRLPPYFTTNQVVAAPVILSPRAYEEITTENSRDHREFRKCELLLGIRRITPHRNDGSKSPRNSENFDPSQILVCSTGVIGVPLRWKKFWTRAEAGSSAWKGDAWSFERVYARDYDHRQPAEKAAAKFRIGGKQVRISDCAKGAGMIQPNMATMLAFMATDAAISPALLARALRAVVEPTFNASPWMAIRPRTIR